MEGEPVGTSEAGAEGAVVQPPPQGDVPPLASAAPIVNTKKKMKVMVAVDESEESFYALKWAVDNLFPSTVGGETITEPMVDAGMLTILHVYYPFQNTIVPAGFGTAPVVYAPTGMVETVRKSQEKLAAVVLSRALEICKQKMIKAETMILEGDAKYRICQAAEETHVDLLIVGSRGLGMVKRAFLGSVSNYCVHHVKCPVLIVKPPKSQ